MPGNTPGSGVDPMLLGSFQDGNGQQTLDCDFMAGAANEVMLRVLFDWIDDIEWYMVCHNYNIFCPQATIAHSGNQGGATSVQFTWTAPSTAGVVDF